MAASVLRGEAGVHRSVCCRALQIRLLNYAHSWKQAAIRAQRCRFLGIPVLMRYWFVRLLAAWVVLEAEICVRLGPANPSPALDA